MNIEKEEPMMHFDASPCSREVGRYEKLSDQELYTEIAAAEILLLRAKEGYAILIRRCESDIATMRRVLTDRIVDMCQDDEPVSDVFRRKLEALIVRNALPQGSLQKLIRKLSKGRAHSLDELSEIQALVIWFCLGGDPALA
jgi:hypothetical protein